MKLYGRILSYHCQTLLLPSTKVFFEKKIVQMTVFERPPVEFPATEVVVGVEKRKDRRRGSRNLFGVEA